MQTLFFIITTNKKAIGISTHDPVRLINNLYNSTFPSNPTKAYTPPLLNKNLTKNEMAINAPSNTKKPPSTI